MRSLCLLLIVLQVFPVYGMQGVIEMGYVGSFSSEAKKRLPYFEKDLERLLENAQGFQVEVQSGKHHFTQVEYQAFSEVEKLKMYLRELRKAPLVASDLNDLRKLQGKFERLGIEGNILQESYLAEAYSLWKRGDRKASEKLIIRALHLHPEGLGEFMSDWFDLEGANAESTSFGLLLDAKRMKILRGCELNVSNSSATRSIYVNGFWIQAQKNYHFQTGRVYRISAGPHYEPALASCTKTGSQQVSLPTEKVVQKDIGGIVSHAKAALFISEKDGKLHADSFSPGRRIIPSNFVEAERTGKVKSTENQSLEDFGRYHRLTPMDLAITNLKQVSSHPEPSAGITESATRPWYQSWVFWTITGAVAAGAATYLLTKGSGEPTIATNPTGIKISVE